MSDESDATMAFWFGLRQGESDLARAAKVAYSALLGHDCLSGCAKHGGCKAMDMLAIAIAQDDPDWKPPT